MKIAILGTKGIPNNYGGYEQFAEYISTRLVARGNQVTVYNPSFHTYSENIFNGVIIRKIFSPEKWIGGAANIIYDHLCLQDALKHDFDIIYEAGYHSVAMSLKYFNVKSRKKPIVITNMDGLEWKRTKWNKPIQRIIKKLEKIAVNESPYLIADNIGIQDYLRDKFAKESYYIPYGADPVVEYEEGHLKEYNVEPFRYFILVARLEPENNIETVLNGHCNSSSKLPILVVGNHQTKYGDYLKTTFQNQLVKFVGGIYTKSKLDSLRFFSKAYFHGHSVGGTNPSLLEAMACKSFIWAHQNAFNRAILDNNAFYFSNQEQVTKLIEDSDRLVATYGTSFKDGNFQKIEKIFNWEKVVLQHEELFERLLSESSISDCNII